MTDKMSVFFAIALATLLGCEVVLLAAYLSRVASETDARVRMEYANAEAARCKP